MISDGRAGTEVLYASKMMVLDNMDGCITNKLIHLFTNIDKEIIGWTYGNDNDGIYRNLFNVYFHCYSRSDKVGFNILENKYKLLFT